MKREHLDMTERAVLGAMLLGDRGEGLEPGDFYLDSNRRIFTLIRTLQAQGKPVDELAVYGELERRKELDAIGGLGYLSSLTDPINRVRGIEGHVKTLRKEAQRRALISFCAAATARAEDGDEPEDILAEIANASLQAQMQGCELRPIHISELIVPFVNALQQQREFQGECLGVTTGIPMLDKCTTGWREGELTYVGALPGRGKTSFMLQAMYAAAKAGITVGCISLEMRREQLMRRLSVLHSGISSRKLRDAREMNVSEYEHVRRTALHMDALPIWIQDQSGLRPGQIASLARQMHNEGCRVIFVDFVQIIHEDGRERREAINRVSASLRDTCKALNIPFVVASQLARRDADPNRRPTLQDLRESGNLEQDAHNVLMLFRPKDKASGDWNGEDEIIIEKAREGITGPVLVRYDGEKLMYVERGA